MFRLTVMLTIFLVTFWHAWVASVNLFHNYFPSYEHPAHFIVAGLAAATTTIFVKFLLGP